MAAGLRRPRALIHWSHVASCRAAFPKETCAPRRPTGDDNPATQGRVPTRPPTQPLLSPTAASGQESVGTVSASVRGSYDPTVSRVPRVTPEQRPATLTAHTGHQGPLEEAQGSMCTPGCVRNAPTEPTEDEEQHTGLYLAASRG